LFKTMSLAQLAQRLFIAAPYLSLVLNTRNHPLTMNAAEAHRAMRIPFPKPKRVTTFTDLPPLAKIQDG
jgi:hypothetical protein